MMTIHGKKQGSSFWRWPGEWLQSYRSQKRRKQAVLANVELVVDIADPEIREEAGYKKRLFEPVEHVKQFCSGIIADIPGPVHLDHANYFDDPTVKALFASPENLDEVLRISPEVQELRKSGFVGEAAALLTMTMEEKTVYGYQQEGELLLRDVAQRAVNFTDHRLVAPSADLAAVRLGVAQHGLVVLATFAMEKITSCRSRVEALREKRAYLRGAIKILGGKNKAHYRFAVPSPSMLAELKKAETALLEVEQELAEAEKEYSSPADALRYLDEVIRNPELAISLQQQKLSLNWMNVRLDKLPEEKGSEISLAEFHFPDDVKRSAIFVTFILADN